MFDRAAVWSLEIVQYKTTMPLKKKSLAAQMAAQGPTKGQKLISSRVQQYDELIKKGPLTREESSQAAALAPTKRDRKIACAVKREARRVKKGNRRAHHRNVLALLGATTKHDAAGLRFCGDIIRGSREEAIHSATEASAPAASFNTHHQVLFVSGTSVDIDKCKHKLDGTAPGMRSAGAAVVYRKADGENQGQIWGKKLFGLGLSPRNPTHQGIESSIVAIGEALALAATEMAYAKNQETPDNDQSVTKPKVMIFTDNQASLSKIRDISLTEKQLERSTPGREKLITRSQYLHHLGAEVELRWSPAKSGAAGSRRAETAARKAAASLMYRKGGDDLDENLQILIESL